MKKITALAAIILSGCYLANQEIHFEEIYSFKTVVFQEANRTKIKLSGLLGNSSMGISDIKTKIEGNELNITLFQRLSNGKYSGKLNEEITISDAVTVITYGSERKILWEK
ncbi:hypothetical protein E5343_07145 [Rodentibacter caecimuris]|uniref:hypothetical protein n=1 Tax=Rodentibacter caecimuris TaxID=1796644 RepID=UPI00109497AE|nr:hypothetical protein [Pasteurella caecimuris]TGY49364.1 hypothetical protein E5343_07145 [Pasteurella caecimuris]